MKPSQSRSLLVCAFFLLSFPAIAQQGAVVPARVTEAIDPEKLVVLQGNTHPLARPAFDRGAAPDSQPIRRMLLVLKRSPEQEAELRHLLDEQQTKSSPNFHKWLTPEEFGRRFGPADEDVQAVTGWLTTQGFQVSRVAAGRTVIEFSGTAGQVRQAFHTEMHKYAVNGEENAEAWANASNPQIPAALAPVVTGLASLNNFPRKSMVRRLGAFQRTKATGELKPLFTFNPSGTPLYAVGPWDFATAYNVLPLWNASPPIDGTGQTIAIVAETDINPQDVMEFRAMFGLPVYPPNIIYNGPNPGITFEEEEGDIDSEWSGGVAPGATIDYVVSESTESSAGVDLSALYIIDNNLAPVMSESYGDCELFLGNAGNAFYYGLWEQAAAQGITVMIAAGDSGSAGCDDFSIQSAAFYGAMVSGFASTPFNIAVGGTDFNDVAAWTTYWNSANTSATNSSAKSYIPETTWNDSCARLGNPAGCPDPLFGNLDIVAGSGGPSNCALSTVTSTSYTCTAGYPKPSWQTGTGVPNDGVRDIPDVSLFAADGAFSGSFYVFCESDAVPSGSCDLNAPYTDFLGAGGTSFSAPTFAGIMALVNQKYGRQGNANYVLYNLAAQSGASCTSDSTAPRNSSCIFYDVNNIVGLTGNKSNNSVACLAGTPNCSNQGTSGLGITVANPCVDGEPCTPPTTFIVAWTTTAGYDYATGLGSVNAANLVNNWSSVTFTPSTTTITGVSPSPITITHGQSATFDIQVAPTPPATGTPTGDVSLIAQVSNSGGNSPTTGVGMFTLSSGAASGTTNLLPAGTYNVTAHYAGDGTFGASDSSPVSVTVKPEPSQTLVGLVTFNFNTGAVTSFNATTTPYGSPYYLRVDVTNSSGSPCAPSPLATVPGNGSIVYPCPTGQVSLTDNGAPLDLGTYLLNSQGYLEDQPINLSVGTHNIVASYAGDNSYNASTSATDTITITSAATTTTVSAPSPVAVGASVTLTALVATQSLGAAPTGTVTFFNNGTPIGSPVPVIGTRIVYPACPPAIFQCEAAQASLVTSFTAPASITAQYSGDSSYGGSVSAAAPIAIGTPDFNLSASPTSLSLTPGQGGASALVITPLVGFTGTVTLSCSGAPAASSCSVIPSSVVLNGSSVAVATSLIVTTTASVPPLAPGGRIPPSLRLRLGWPWLLALAMLISLMLLRARRAPRQLMGTGSARRYSAVVLLTTLLVVAIWAGCGRAAAPPPPPATAPGTYPLVVTAASANISHTATVTLTVQ